jgi:ABC-2 type transport system ATP-binding protein
MNQVLPALVGRNLCKTFFTKASGQITKALLDVSIEVPTGSLTALVGPDGAGKTTLLRLAAGLMTADQGTLIVLGIDAASDPQAIQARISYMPQRFGLYEDLSVQENLDLYADLHSVPSDVRQERYERLLKMTNLTSFTGRPTGKLSGGMKQKLGLACTLVRLPELLLLDEPTVGVDPLSRRELWEIVQQLVYGEELTVITSTAYLNEAEYCAKVFLLHEGKLLAQGSPQDIRDHAKGRCFIVSPLLNEPPRYLQAKLLDQIDTIIDAVPQGGSIRFVQREKNASLAELLDGLNIQEVEPRLEDGFMVLLRQERDPVLPPDSGLSSILKVKVASQGRERDDTTIIEVQNLARMFGEFTAVASTSFSVKRGEIFGLLGPNGAGKTTTFRMLCGLLPATSGFLQVAGVDLRHARAAARRNIGYVSQRFALYGNLTVKENLEFFGGAYGLYGKRLRERMSFVMDQFDLTGQERSPSGQLPGGFKQRLAMATALLHNPEILFLDEPTSGIDPLARREFWRRITALSAQGTTIIITTHFMEEAEYCDRIVIQDAGALLAIGTPYEVRQKAGASAGGRMSMEEAFISIVQKGRAENVQREPEHEGSQLG